MCRKLIYLASVVLVLGLARTSVANDWDPDNDPNLVGYWKLDDGAGTIAVDSSGGGNNGTLVGDPQWTAGRLDGALEFDGNDHVDTGYTEDLTNWTVACWVNSPAAPSGDSPSGPVHREQNYQLNWNHSDATYRGAAALNAGGSWHAASYMPLEADTWYHLAATYDGNVLTAYRNGVLITSNSSPSGPPSAETNSLKIARHAAAEQFYTGRVDEVRIYDRALTAAEIDVLVPPQLKAYKPSPADGVVGVDTPLFQWTAGDTAISHLVYLGTDPDDLTFIGEMGWTVYWHAAGLTPGMWYYWRVDEKEADGTVHEGDLWSFMATPLIAWDPSPADGATDVMITTQLRWSPGKTITAAVKHHLFFGTDEAEVADGTGDADKGILDDPAYDPGLLLADTTYYMRVNEVETDGSEREGDLWSFETVPAGPGKILRQWWLGLSGTTLSTLTGNARYPDDPDGWEWVDLFEGPVDWQDNYGSRLSGWLFPPATGDYTFWIATDDPGQCWLSTDEDPANAVMICEVTGWVPSRDFDNTGGGTGGGAIQRSVPITLEAGKRYWIEAMMKEGGGGDNIAVAWQGPGIPVREVISAEYVGPTPYLPEKAYAPSPGDGSSGVPDTSIISWQPGVKAVQHDVYFGTDADAVAAADTTTAGIYRGRLSTTSYIPTESPLEWGVTYYVRVDEVNNDATMSTGKVWSFTVADYIVIDDFEDYNDYTPDRIFQTWLDGYGYTDPPPGKTGNGTGSTVGHLTYPYAEQTTVHGGGQSMPFGYDNTGAGGKARYSEAEREFLTAQDFSRRGVMSISLWVYGDPCNVPAPVYVGLQDSAGTRMDVPETDTNLVLMTGWQEINIELSEFEPVNLASVKKIFIGVGNRLSPVPGPTGDLFIDDIRLYRPRCVPSKLKPANDLNDDCAVDYLDLEIVVNEWLTSGHLVTPTDPGTAGLIAYYPLDGNVNDTVGGYNGTPNGGPAYGPGRVGQAIRLDGLDDYVVISSVGISGADARTIACWAKADTAAIADWTNIFGFSGPASNGQHFDLEILGSTTGATSGWFGLHVHGWERDILPNDLDWHHLAASHDGTTARWYGDGRLIGSEAIDINSPGNIHMGKREDNDNYFPGLVDEARVFNRVLSDGEVASLAGLTLPYSAAFDLNADDAIDFLDVAILGDAWLDELLWPAGP